MRKPLLIWLILILIAVGIVAVIVALFSARPSGQEWEKAFQTIDSVFTAGLLATLASVSLAAAAFTLQAQTSRTQHLDAEIQKADDRLAVEADQIGNCAKTGEDDSVHKQAADKHRTRRDQLVVQKGKIPNLVSPFVDSFYLFLAGMVCVIFCDTLVEKSVFPKVIPSWIEALLLGVFMVGGIIYLIIGSWRLREFPTLLTTTATEERDRPQLAKT